MRGLREAIDCLSLPEEHVRVEGEGVSLVHEFVSSVAKLGGEGCDWWLWLWS